MIPLFCTYIVETEGFFVEITGKLRGVTMTIAEINTNYRLRCAENCRERPLCPLRRLCDRPGEPEPRLALVSLIVANGSAQAYSLAVDGWELVDARGFAVGGAAVCERLLPIDHVQADLWSVSSSTRVRTMLAFPLTDGIRALIYSDGEDSVCFPIAPARRPERLKGKPVIRLKKRGKIRITECWSQKDGDGWKYVFIGEKK